MTDIDLVWKRIGQHEGEIFKQKGGNEFTFTVRGNSLKPSRTNRLLPKSQFEEALGRLPVEGPGRLSDLQGPSYLYAILMDERIRRNEW